MSKMFIGTAILMLTWIFVRYHGLTWPRLLIWAVGSFLFILGMMEVMVVLHNELIR